MSPLLKNKKNRNDIIVFEKYTKKENKSNITEDREYGDLPQSIEFHIKHSTKPYHHEYYHKTSKHFLFLLKRGIKQLFRCRLYFEDKLNIPL